MAKVKVGVIGYGNMGSAHSKNIYAGKVKDMELVSICDIDPEKLAKAASQCQGVKTFDNASDMFKSGIINTVIIAVPHYLHPPMAVEAFSYGLNVLSEKPAGVYTKQVLEMNEAAKKSGKVFGIMFNQRTNPLYQKVKQMVESGELGHIKRISWIITDWYRPQAYHDSCTWRSTWATEGGGTLINQNPHQLDLWQWMFGLPDKVWADCSFGKYRNIEVDDDVTAYFKYDNGTTGTYITSTGEAPGTNRLEVASDMGRIVVEDGKLSFLKLEMPEPEFNLTTTSPFGCPKSAPCEVEIIGEQTAHVGILNNFASAIANGTPLLAKGEEGIKALTLGNSIYYSSWTGSWVDVKNFPHDDFYSKLQEKIASSEVNKKESSVTVNLDGTY
ncbi:MAG: Gfo/Idh/MocA family oxidoreductase [Bacillota bacterium]|nr:Gfo/Idh/MocA family oxidoreductase [Bacillota bacterium]